MVGAFFISTAAAALMRAQHVRGVVGPYDVLRAFVLGQSAVIIALYGAAVVREARCAVRATEEWERQAWQGRIALMFAILALIYDEVLRVWDRLGNSSLNPRTPSLQIALWLLLVAYFWVIRRYWTGGGTTDAVLQGRRS